MTSKRSKPLREVGFVKARWSPTVRFASLSAALALSPRLVLAAPGSWTGLAAGADNNWSTLGNWSASPVPGSGDTATFNGAGNSKTTVAIAAVTVSSIVFDSNSVAAYTLGSSAGTGTITLNASGSVNLNSGINNHQLINSNLSLGTAAGNQSFSISNNSSKTLTIAGAITTSVANNKTLSIGGSGNTAVSGNITVAGVLLTKSGAGILTLSGTNTGTGATTLNAGTLVLNSSGGTAINGPLTLNGGIARIDGTNGNQIGGGSSTQAITMAGGTFDLNGKSEAIRAINGSSGLITNSNIGTTSTLTLNENQSVNYGGNINDGVDGVGGKGVVALSMITNNNVRIFTASNTFSGGTTFSIGTLRVGNNSALGTGDVSIGNAAGIKITSDSSSSRSLANNLIATNGIQFGETGFTGSLSFGTFNGTPGTVSVQNDQTTFSSLGQTTAGALTKSGPGHLIVTGNSTSNATTLNTGLLAIGGTATFNGLLTMSGGVLGHNGTFTKSLGSGATNVTFGSAVDGSGFAAYGGDLTVAIGGTTNPTALTWAGNGGTNRFVATGKVFTLGHALSTGTVTLTNAIDLNNATQSIEVNNGLGSIDAQLDGILSNGALTKSGAGTLLLRAANTYSGPTSITGGTLLVGHSGIGSISNSSVTVNSGATLGGTGTVGAVTVDAGGTLSPGIGTGIFRSGSVSLTGGGASGAKFSVEVNGVTAGSGYDQQEVTGIVDLNSNDVGGGFGFNGADLVLALTGSYIPFTTSFTLIENDGSDLVQGRFGSVNGTPINHFDPLGNGESGFDYFSLAGKNFIVYYNFNSDGGSVGNDVVLAVVPEPATTGLLAAAMLGTLTRRRRKMR